jgi:mono/diheme cytochrome c family protein
VLGTWLFVLFWILLGVGVFFVAIQRGPRGARATLQSQSHGARRAAGVGFTLVYVAFGVAVPALLLTGNHANANSQYAGIPLTPAEKHGRILFGQHCGVCHTLAAANAVGKVGPDLDTLQPSPSQSLVLHTIENGCLEKPGPPSESCLGYGTMPAGILAGVEAQDAAKFVAAVAGKE